MCGSLAGDMCLSPCHVLAAYLAARILREDVNIFVAGKNIASLQGLQTLLAEGDEVALFPAVIGG